MDRNQIDSSIATANKQLSLRCRTSYLALMSTGHAHTQRALQASGAIPHHLYYKLYLLMHMIHPSQT